LPVPGEIVAPPFGLRLRIDVCGLRAGSQTATLRNWRPGDRVTLRHSSGPRKVKEVLERLRVTGTSRALWPVLELGGRIIWMRGADLEPEQGIAVVVTESD
jgi:tRNA(Ile)-lysidine synthase